MREVLGVKTRIGESESDVSADRGDELFYGYPGVPNQGSRKSAIQFSVIRTGKNHARSGLDADPMASLLT